MISLVRGGVGARTVRQHRDPGVGEPVRDESGIQRRGDRAGALAHHDHLVRAGECGRQAVERGGAVDVALVVHGEAGGVFRGGVADVRVTRAVGDVDGGVVGERVALVGEIEHAALPGRALVDPGLMQVAVGCARLRREAGAAGLQVEDHLPRVRLAEPEAELRAVGAATVAARDDPLPALIAGGRRGGRRLRAGHRRGGGRAPIVTVAASRRDRGCQRGR